MPTIADVALRAGVSTATVSRVLSTPEIVLEATRKKVMAAVDALQYQPNYAAKSLRTLRSNRIVVTVPDIANPFFSSVIRGVEAAAQEAGYSVLLGDSRHEPEREELYASMLWRKEADGLIFLGHRLPDTLANMVENKRGCAPVVNGCEFSPELGVSSVHIDNTKAAIEAMDLLYDLGHKRIGVITGMLASPISQDRLAGVRECAARRGLEDNLEVTIGDFSVKLGAEKARSLLTGPHPPSAIFCFSDEMAIGALRAIGELGLNCPADISVIGFDDVSYAQYLRPALTTVAQPKEEIGRETVRLLLGILGGVITKPVIETLPHRLVLRESTGPFKAAR
jgi:LacI family repressor for deo operon, udp, cdd, tsx, nupC, and nupG